MTSSFKAALAVSALVVAAAVAAPGPAAAAAPEGSYLQTCRHIETDKSNGARRVTAECQDRKGNWQSSRLKYENCQNQRVANDNGTLVCESDGGRLPGGSWSQSCRNGATRNGWLYADCQRANGGWRDSSINPRDCGNRGVANNDGRLVCEGGGGGNVPGGSWQQTCRNSNMQRGTLYAQCQRANGGWRDASIDPRDCPGNRVANNDGRLVCEGGGGGGNLPGGSWQQTCRNSNMQRGTLYAQCQRANGGWRDSSIDPRSCGNRGVSNNDGNLVCEGGGGGGNLPGGSWQQSCRDPQVSDGVLTAKCQGTDGRWGNAWINFGRCPTRRVANSNGTLVCE